MNIRVVKNKYINTLFLLMLFSAIVHMLILFYVTITTGNLYVLNYFNILDIDYFVPDLVNGFWGNIFAVFSVLLVYFVILNINKVK